MRKTDCINLRRRQLSLHLACLLASVHSASAMATDRQRNQSRTLRDQRAFSPAQASQTIRLPQDHGPHPDFRTEWWYFTGWFTPETARGSRPADPIGLQITFFRSAPNTATDNPVRMAPAQLLFAHVAVADAARGTLLHDQIARRAGLADTRLEKVSPDGAFELRVGQWHLRRHADGRWSAVIRTSEFSLTCNFRPAQAEWLQGEAGFSRKGPSPTQASHYITLPHLDSEAQLVTRDAPGGQRLKGLTWMDHEWSTSVLDERAAGWDWVGLHGTDGSALMAFRIRPQTVTSSQSAGSQQTAVPSRATTPSATAVPYQTDEGKGSTASPAAGSAPFDISALQGEPDLWQHAALRRADGSVHHYRNVRFEPLTHWTSPRTGTRYPVAMRLYLDDEVYELTPLMPDQELDSRMSTGTVYWEGAMRVTRRSRPVTGTPRADDTQEWGRGYLELTGYGKPMKL